MSRAQKEGAASAVPSLIFTLHSHRLPGAFAWGGRFFVKTLWMIAPGNQGLDLSIFEERSKFSNKSQKQVFFLFKWQEKTAKRRKNTVFYTEIT